MEIARSPQSIEAGKYVTIAVFGCVVLTAAYILFPLYEQRVASMLGMSDVMLGSPLLQLLLGVWVGAFLTAAFMTSSPRGGMYLVPVLLGVFATYLLATFIVSVGVSFPITPLDIGDLNSIMTFGGVLGATVSRMVLHRRYAS
ncbi:MAG TPA: hypothetical protein VJH33_00320 [Candidatus Paceibacterota bacterium]